MREICNKDNMISKIKILKKKKEEEEALNSHTEIHSHNQYQIFQIMHCRTHYIFLELLF